MEVSELIFLGCLEIRIMQMQGVLAKEDVMVNDNY